ncbi:hypothetical protein TRFO_22326 [Tritrichomonas foetus]|uniref:Uncharacterized protein n=1 Tax=Tritrichomonas foetus TaxID=1144522 RepID=A0A1J4KI19_9EUKA|nr:hypothetical protein [Tritrichomonas foetus]OHT08981.1 hypothetical protein TRFO_22326 [Tritrichomonas foetus]|eukprot:OHT08981.1 hypothetical protein TRFO_22326 [Tritrichomonas foetus]
MTSFIHLFFHIMSCSFCTSGIGYSRTTPSPPPYQAPLIDGTTEAILELRRQCKGCDHAMAQKAKGRLHWSNIPSGADFQREFDRKYPALSGYGSQVEYSEFPYRCHAPPPQRPQSSLLSYSNLPPARFPQQSYVQPSRVSLQNVSSSYSSHHHHRRSHHDDEDARIKRALQHIDHASRILEKY